MATNIKKEIKKNKRVSFTNKDFSSLRNELKRYALTHFQENIVDFSDASLGGLILDLGAYVGDVMAYYIDHQFNENSIENAIETVNLERLIREAGIKIPSATPAYAQITMQITVPAQLIRGEYVPQTSALPTVKKNSVFSTPTGVDFHLLEDVNFGEVDESGNLITEYSFGRVVAGVPRNIICTRSALASSARIATENFRIPDTNERFRTISLGNDNVNEIISVFDGVGDEYFEVDSLTQDTVFKIRENTRFDIVDVPSRIEMFHAPKRYISSRSTLSGKTTLRFGAGNETEFDEDIIPDPSEHALKLFGDRTSLPMIAIDPNNFLTTQTLGISPRNTTLTVNYRYGGGLSHNVSAGEITSIKSLITQFPTSTPAITVAQVRASAEVINLNTAVGGEDEPSIEELRNIAIFNRSAQNRIVTREDLIARVYTLPNQFGRVFRVGVADNPNNPRGVLLYVISRNKSRKLTISPDTLKQNLAKYLNKFRLVSDAVDILDARIINIGFEYAVTIETGYRPEIVISSINQKLTDYFRIDKAQINKPIPIGEVDNLILNTPGVISIVSNKPISRTGNNTSNGNPYSPESFNPANNIDRGYLFPPDGGIFEVKFPSDDIVGRVI